MKTKKDDDRLDKLFEEATIKAAEIKGKQFLQEVETGYNRPSAEFDRRIQAMIETKTRSSERADRFSKISFVLSKAPAWILLALVILFITVLNVSAARDWVTKLVIESNPKFVTYYLQNQGTGNEINLTNQGRSQNGLLPNNTYVPSYIPEGMKLMHLEVSVNGVSYYYQNEAYDFVSIDVLGSGATLKVENEGLEVESSETVHGMEATYRIKSGVSDVIWSDEEHIFIVSTTFSKEECFRIAEGLIN